MSRRFKWFLIGLVAATLVVTATPVESGTKQAPLGCGPEFSVVPSWSGEKSNSVLYGAAMVAGTPWAVGLSYPKGTNGSPIPPLIERWDGEKMVLVPALMPGAGGWLNTVSGSSPGSVLFGGAYYKALPTKTTSGRIAALIMRYNGRKVSIVSSPSLGKARTEIFGVKDFGETSFFVGFYMDSMGVGSLGRAFMLRLDRGRIAYVPLPVEWGSALFAVDGSSPNDVVAVGFLGNKSLVIHWNGQTAVRVDSPNSGSVENVLRDVAVPSPGIALMTGYSADVSLVQRPLNIRWNRSDETWTSHEATKLDLAPEGLAMAALSETEVWVLGGVFSPGSLPQGISVHQTQTFPDKWVRVKLPKQLKMQRSRPDIHDVVSASSQVWVAGSVTTGSGKKAKKETLVLRACPSPLQSSP